MIPKKVVIKNFGERYEGNGDEIFYTLEHWNSKLHWEFNNYNLPQANIGR